jgi:hypothetical protein
VSKTNENFTINPDFTIRAVSEAAPADLATAEPTDFSGISFNLNLTETEKKAKEGLTLPYVKTESKVIYYPDKDDDIDEDDPDDDLDI